MYDPKFRMAILISIAVSVFTVINVILEYVIGDASFQFDHYIIKVSSVGSALIGGFVFVLVCTKFITFEKYRKTGFEATYRDETGTGFNFPVSLSKYMPDIIASPGGQEIHPVEAELLGFINGYRDWPYDITGQDSYSLHTHTMKQWTEMCKLPNAKEPHRIAALAQDLGKVFAYKESRRPYPLRQFWKQDKVAYSRRCVEHGGLSAFILGTMPSFLSMPERRRRAILIAVRFRDNPTFIPANCDPLALEIYEMLHMAAEKVAEAEGYDAQEAASEEDIAHLTSEIDSFFGSIIRSLEVNPAGQSSKSDGIYLGDGLLVLKMSNLVKAFASALSPEVRRRFTMWRLDGKAHPCWPAFIAAFTKMNLLMETFQNAKTNNGLYNVKIGDHDLKNCIVLKIDVVNQSELRHSLDALPKYAGVVEVIQDEASLKDEIIAAANSVDEMLKQARESL